MTWIMSWVSTIVHKFSDAAPQEAQAVVPTGVAPTGAVRVYFVRVGAII